VPDDPLVTRYPHDRLSRLADAMTAVLGRLPEVGDVRAIVLLDDGEGGTVHPYGYPQPPEGQQVLFADLAQHLMSLGQVLGVEVTVRLDGYQVARRD
jgi:hypothetical protein